MALISSDVAPFTLLPAVTPVSGDEQLAAAEAAFALADASDTALRPFGRTWVFDHNSGQFFRNGSAPAGCNGLDSLVQWIYAAVNTPRLAALIHSEDYGVDIDDLFFGGAGTSEDLADYEVTITEAILIHDRVQRVTGFDFSRPDNGDALFVSFSVQTDQYEQIEITDAPLYGRA